MTQHGNKNCKLWHTSWQAPQIHHRSTHSCSSPHKSHATWTGIILLFSAPNFVTFTGGGVSLYSSEGSRDLGFLRLPGDQSARISSLRLWFWQREWRKLIGEMRRKESMLGNDCEENASDVTSILWFLFWCLIFCCYLSSFGTHLQLMALDFTLYCSDMGFKWKTVCVTVVSIGFCNNSKFFVLILHFRVRFWSQWVFFFFFFFSWPLQCNTWQVGPIVDPLGARLDNKPMLVSRIIKIE